MWNTCIVQKSKLYKNTPSEESHFHPYPLYIDPHPLLMENYFTRICVNSPVFLFCKNKLFLLFSLLYY